MFRGQKNTFDYDPLALVLAQEAIAQAKDVKLNETQRSFMYMPFMHSESKEIQQQPVALFTQLGKESNLKYAIERKEIIDQFGRYPHRNKQLNRVSSQ